ncbi:N-acetylmuramoyl-L-alanine amidase-like domain-containing protein [Spirosoma sp. SC4-14]|uniref:N-acetylmuramoyl-L-alanine amidase-like domain-containing protein n=1 Tax=Spirosoma sp. SC4-14 TaxID=3128900 RepID=UPI0030CF142C
MINLFTAFFLLLTPAALLAQESAPDDLKAVTIAGGRTPAETVVNIGKQLIGRPYVAHTLDENQTEQLVVNVREFDCTTYVETVLALALSWHELPDKNNSTALDQTFRKFLTKLRYRDGRIDGYASRLHYFSDWLRDNERKGLILDVTRDMPGSIVVAKPVSYMTTATYKYPRLTDPAIYKQVALAESELSQQPFHFIPKKNIRQAESQLREGDIVMLTAARPGLDMKHVGFAVRQPNGRIHLLHASSEQGEVVITAYPLSDYVFSHKRLSGIRVARLRPANTVATASINGGH